MKKENGISYSIQNVIFSTDGLYERYWVYDEEKGEGEHAVIKVKDDDCDQIFCDLRRICEIKEGTTLRNIMDFVRGNKYLSEFIAKYSSVNKIELFHKELDLEPNTDKIICQLVISRVTELQDNEFEEWINLIAIGEPWDDELMGIYGKHIPLKERGNSYAVAFSPLPEILDLPVVLDKKITIRELGEEPIWKGEREFTLIEILDAIYWELSFHGSPKDRDSMHDELSKALEKIKSENSDSKLDK